MGEKRKRSWIILGIATVLVAGLVVLALMPHYKKPTLLVTGIVKDAATGAPIVGAKVFDDGYGPKPWKGAATGFNGGYRYMTWAEEHNVAAQVPGYKKESKLLTTNVLQTDKEKVLDFALVRQ